MNKITRKELTNKTIEIFGKIILIISYPIITILTAIIYCFIELGIDSYKTIKKYIKRKKGN